ncbi:DNA-formamidopyrimidine glycosylase [Spiroplasma endosymbiont of Labia minor]|uniref:DNA-formamidopyrimidine glycosylase n=1 Tax=Spiroplasma endosymbiont of Labia minor TaxID=3066305 RepID=UPI0030D0A153
MPELPEVRTVIKILKSSIVGEIISDVRIFWNTLVKFPTKEDLIKRIINKKITDLKSFGKWIFFMLENDDVLVSHLRMTGMWYFEKQSDQFWNQKHLHAVIDFKNGNRISFYDSRGFGVLNLYTKEEFNLKGPQTRMGPEPWDDNFTFENIKPKIFKSKRAIKSIILDQSVISGIGNIYADEILFASSINPERSGDSLNDNEIKQIIIHSKKILEDAILNGGTTIHSYHPKIGETGGFQDKLKIHLRKGKECLRCGKIVMKIRVGERGTYFCPQCQK